jgi:cytochrome P450
MQTITLEVIVRVVFGVRGLARFEELSAALRKVLEPMGGRLRAVLSILAGDGFDGGPDAARFAARRAAVDALLYDEIIQRRGAPDLAERDDVLSMLLLATDEEGRGMTDTEVRDELVTILLAGHETTATGLAWTFEQLVRHPGVLREVRRELDAGGHEYLDAVIKESLRARPVLPNVGRVLAEAHELFGHVLPAGTGVLPSITLLHRRAATFPEPEAFRPERFLGAGPSGYAWIPFGGGIRRCLGASFALLEMRVVLQTVLRELDLVPARRAPEGVVRRGITLTPADGGRVVAREPAARPACAPRSFIAS